jgi:MscS family membrane protein
MRLSAINSLLMSLAQNGAAPATGDANGVIPEPRAAAGPDFWQYLYDWFDGWVPDWMQGELLGLRTWQLFAAFLCILVGLVLWKVSDFVFKHVIARAVRKTRFKADDLIAEAFSKPVGVVFVVLGLWAAAAMLNLGAQSEGLRTLVRNAAHVALTIDVMWLVFRFVDVLAVYMTRAAERTNSKLDDQLVPLIKKSLKVFTALLISVAVLQNLGYNVGSLLAGLGIGGLAVALAAKDTLANFFGGLVILTDRPFRVGDWVVIGDVEGTIEQIGFRSTRVRTFPKTLVTIPNSKLVDSAINNKTAMPLRRVRMTVGVTYETSADEMQVLLEDIKQIIQGDADIDQDVIIVRFTNFGDSSLDVLMQYFTRPIPFAEHSVVVERVNLAVMRAVEARGLSIAFPTRTVYFEGDVAKGLAGMAAGDEPKA